MIYLIYLISYLFVGKYAKLLRFTICEVLQALHYYWHYKDISAGINGALLQQLVS